MTKFKMQPIRLTDGEKRDVRTQFGAVCYREREGKIQVLLVTSLTTRRWIVPKGWPMDNTTPQKAALREAWEEAGVKGKVRGNSLGIYSYEKETRGEKLPCVVALFAVEVSSVERNYPEAKLRKRKWVSRKKAAELLSDPELAQIIRNFSPE